MSSTSLGRSARGCMLVASILAFSLLLFSAGAAAQSTATGTIEGTVTNEIDEKLSGVTINVTGNSSLSTTTGNDGRYKIKNIPNGDRVIEIGDERYDNQTQTIPVSTTNSPVTANFTLERTTGTLTGTVNTTLRSTPVNGSIPQARIKISHDSAQDIITGTNLKPSTTTDQSGNYLIAVPTGNLTITVTQDGFTRNKTRISGFDATGTTKDVRLTAKLSNISGYVKNKRGDGVKNSNVSITTDDFAIWPNLTRSDLSTTTNDVGRYTLTNVPRTTTNDDRHVVADAATFQPDTKRLRIASANPPAKNFTLSHQTGTLTGTVTDSYGNKLTGIDVTVTSSTGTTYQDTTDTSGVYEFSDVPFGTLAVNASHPDYKPNKTTVEVKAGGTTQQGFTLSRTTPVQLSISSVTPSFAQSGDTVTITYSYEEQVNNAVEFSVTGQGQTITSERLSVGYNGVSNAERTITIPSRDAIDDGSYTIRFEALGTTVTESLYISNAINPDAVGVLGEPATRTPAGDFATISTGGQYMLIGGNKDSGERQQYLDILYVSGGSTTLNTRLIGTDRSSQKAYGEGVTSYAHSIGSDAGPAARNNTVFEDVSFQGASSLAEFRSNIGISARSAPLQAGRYQLVAGEKGRVTLRDDGDVGFVKSVGRSNLVLTQTQRIGEITTYVLPPGKASETTIGEAAGATESQSVAIGERLVIEVPATGMWGATLPDSESKMSAEQIAKLLRNHEGIHIEFAPRDPFNDPNAGAGSLQFSDVSEDDLNVIADTTTDLWENEAIVGDEPTFGGYYIVIDTRGTEPFDNRPGDEEYMRFEMAYESPPGSSYQFQSYDFRGGNQPAPFSPANDPVDGFEHYPYFGDDDTTVQENTTVLFKEPSVQYDRVMPDGDLIVPAQPDGQIFGSTTIAPESQVTIQLISGDGPNPEIVTIEDVTIDEDRRFDVQADFSTLTPGQSVEVEFYAQNRLEENRLIDSRDITVVDNIDNPAQFMIQSLPSEVTVQQRASLGDIQTTIRNTGSISGQKLVEFRINDEPIKNETIILGSNTSETLDLSDQFVTLPVGTYDYTVRTEDDAQTGVLRVTESESGATVTNTGSATTTSSSVTNEQTPGGDGNGDSSPSGIFGLVGVSGRDVALGTAITGAAHVLGYWT